MGSGLVSSSNMPLREWILTKIDDANKTTSIKMWAQVT